MMIVVNGERVSHYFSAEMEREEEGEVGGEGGRAV